MYIPDDFKEQRATEIQRIMQEFPLACIVAQTASGLYATHIPLIFNNQQTLCGHVALANNLYTDLNDGQEVLCIFTGDNAYISANDYPSKFEDHQKVPTWNYQVVHVSGKIQFLHEQKAKLAALGKLTKYMEEKVNGKAAWKMADAPKTYLMEMLDKIVAFDIQITSIQAQSKLSQNKEQGDFAAVVKALQNRGQAALAQHMHALDEI